MGFGGTAAVTKERLAETLTRIGIGVNARGEELTLEEFAALFRSLSIKDF